jgi:hypothetical protein
LAAETLFEESERFLAGGPGRYLGYLWTFPASSGKTGYGASVAVHQGDCLNLTFTQSPKPIAVAFVQGLAETASARLAAQRTACTT